MDKQKIDKIIKLNLGQPVGTGYIDIVVRHYFYEEFINQIYDEGARIEYITWWEFCELDKNPKVGMGGPKCIFYKGWYPEITIPFDSISPDYTPQDIIQFVKLKKIETAFDIWLNVPDSWINEIETDPFYKEYLQIENEVTQIINNWDPLGLIEIGAPENEYNIEIYNFLPTMIINEERGVLHNAFIKYFGDSYRAPKKEAIEIENKRSDCI